MIPFLTLLRRYWPFAVGLALLAYIAVLTIQRNDARADALSARNALAAERASIRAAAAEAKADDLANVRRVEGEQGAITERTSDDFQDRLAELRGAFAERVRAETEAAARRSAGENLPGVPETACRSDESAGQKAVLSLEDARIASEQAEQLIALQAWVRAQSEVKLD